MKKEKSEKLCQFRQHFTCSFFVQKCFKSISVLSSWVCIYFGERKLAQKLVVKCCWNWLKSETKSASISSFWNLLVWLIHSDRKGWFQGPDNDDKPKPLLIFFRNIFFVVFHHEKTWGRSYKLNLGVKKQTKCVLNI